MIPEIKYNTHLAIREYSQFPLSRPPKDLSPAELGTIKNRILVVSTKHTGRVLLQKGKYAEGKNLYQIGRTWDLDELVAITRLSADEIILHLNKNYYWKSGEGPDRLAKFIHHLVVIYQKFSGHYPELKGVTLEELRLPPMALKHPRSSGNSLNATAPAAASQHSPRTSARGSNQDLYKNMDFTVNGKLPMKPMQVMDVDRPSPKAHTSPVSQEALSHRIQAEKLLSDKHSSAASSFNERNPHDDSSLLHDTSRELPSANDNPSFVFGLDAKSPDGSKQTHSVSEYAKQTGALLPLKSYKPETLHVADRNVSDSLETAAAYGLQLQDRLENPDVLEDSIKFQFEIPEDASALDKFEATDVTTLSGDQFKPPAIGSDRDGHNTSESLSNSLLNEVNQQSAIDTSIKDIEDFMNSQFGKSTPELIPVPEPTPVLEPNSVPGPNPVSELNSVPEPILNPVVDNIRQSSDTLDDYKKLNRGIPSIDESNDDSRSNFLYEENSISVKNPDSIETSETDVDIAKGDDMVFERDPEIDEILDEIGWDPTDGTDKSVKLLRQELTTIKHKSVKQLTTLDFGKDSLIKEVLVSLSELDNLVGIFKKMEASLNLLAPEISNIEDNSKGLQVEAVNKKILYNELKEILNKVRLSGRDLEAVAKFDDFEDLQMIPLVENKLLKLYDALVAIGSKSSDDNLTEMKALKQFGEKYESVASSFSEKFMVYIVREFKSAIESLNLEAQNVRNTEILVTLRKIYAFEGINNFVKCVSEKCDTINDNFSSYMCNFVGNLFGVKMKVIYSHARTTSQRNSFRFSNGNDNLVGLRKTKSSRFGSTRFLGKFSNSEEAAKQKHANAALKNSEEIGDTQVVLQIIDDSKELMLVTQFFFGLFFHSTSLQEFSDHIRLNAYEDRMKLFERGDLNTVDYKTNSNELMRNMNQIFGNYINRFIKKVVPSDLIIPQLLIEVYYRLKEADSRSQDFVAYSFLLKVANRYKNSWNKCIAQQVDLLNKSDIRGRGEILPSVKNLGHIILTTETALQETNRDMGDFRGDFDKLIKDSYEQLAKGAVDLFEREDPLLKSNNHDEREKAHRNVAILQNVFTLLQQLSEFEAESTADMKHQLRGVFEKTREEYFRYIVQRHFGKIYDYLRGHGEGDPSGNRRKDDKILVKGIASTHSGRDVALKIQEIRRKMEKHIVTTNTVFEQDLFEVLWKDMENEVHNLFVNFYDTAQAFEKDLDGCVSAREVRRLFQ